VGGGARVLGLEQADQGFDYFGCEQAGEGRT
jgi:hypothetical protein